MKRSQIVLVSILIFVILIWCFVYWLNFIKPPAASGTPETGKVDLCAKFSEIQDTVRCETARTAVLEKYPGEIKYIRRIKAEIPTGLLPNVKMEEKDVWLFGINLTKPTQTDEIELKSVEIFITRDTGELIIKSMASGAI